MKTIAYITVTILLGIISTNAAAQDTKQPERLNPSWSPDSRQLVFYSKHDGQYDLFVVDASGGRPTRLTHTEYSESEPAWSPDGRFIVTSARLDENGSDLVLIDAKTGAIERRLTKSEGSKNSARYSPDGSRLAYQQRIAGGKAEIYILDLDSSQVTRITNDEANDVSPDWLDDDRLVIQSNRGGSYHLYDVDLQSGATEPLTEGDHNCWSAAVSPDGKRVAHLTDQGGSVSLVILDRATGLSTRVPIELKADMHAPEWSPDGKRFAIMIQAEFGWDVFVVNIDGSEFARVLQDAE